MLFIYKLKNNMGIREIIHIYLFTSSICGYYSVTFGGNCILSRDWNFYPMGLRLKESLHLPMVKTKQKCLMPSGPLGALFLLNKVKWGLISPNVLFILYKPRSKRCELQMFRDAGLKITCMPENSILSRRDIIIIIIIL